MGKVNGNGHKPGGTGNTAFGNPDSAEVTITRKPILRVGMVKAADKVDFHLYGSFTIADTEGNKIFSSLESGLRWRAAVEKFQPPRFRHYVHLMDYESYEVARNKADSLKTEGYPAKVMRMGKRLEMNDGIYIDSRRYRLIIGEFQSEEECKPYIEPFIESFNPRVMRTAAKPASGVIEFCDFEYDLSAYVNNAFRIIPEKENCSVIIHDVIIGAGYHWERSVDREYPGIIEIRIDLDGRLWVINEVPIDVYLKSVIPSEMPASYPMEALKAQAIAARSIAFSHLFVKHPNDPFDVCADVHCQAYSGMDSYHERTDSAVTVTSGEVLVYDNQICDAVYSSVCGGHTEHRENVWFVGEKPYLKGSFDGDESSDNNIDLSDEAQVKQWIDSEPDVFCNVSALDPASPLRNAQKYFRWTQSYTTFKLEKIIRDKTGIDIGSFFGIVPLERGVSGRLMKIEILGSNCNHKIRGELNIRRSLSESALRSSCFYTTMKFDSNGIPIEVTFHGAGWGHGVGMCQIGAAVMAEKGFDYEEILKHYYIGTNIERAYQIKKNSNKRSSKYINQEILEE